MLIEMLSRLVARRVRVQRDPVRWRNWSRRRSGAFDRKLEVSSGVGLDWVAKRTVWWSSARAIPVTVGSLEARILTA